jgi:hypothetical protein
MKPRISALAVLIAIGAFGADRHKLDVDPESEDGILLQRIQQEPSQPRRLALLQKYAVEFPKTTSIAWVYEQLLPIYAEAKADDKVIATADALLAIDPDDLDAAHEALRAAESKGATGLIRKYAELSWDIAYRLARKPKPEDPDEVQNWIKQMVFVKQVLDYSEFTMAAQATAEPDKKKKAELADALRTRNPESRYLANIKKVSAIDLASMSPPMAAALAEKGLADDPDNEDFLMNVANFYMTREKSLPKVLSYSLRILDLMQKKSKPDSLTSAAWEQKKAKYTGWAGWMAGVIYGKDARYGPSDRYLRLALPYIQDDAKLLGTAYFYLGYDNYALAGELNDKGRAIEAVKFSKLSAASEGPFQSLARKTLESLRNDFNVE